MSKSILKLDKQSDIASSAYAAGVSEAIGAVQADVNQNEEDADSAISDEADARAAADAALDTAYKAADATLQGNIDVETGRVDAILAASEADKDSFAEIVTLINSVDTENDEAFAAYVLSNNSAVAALQADVDGNEADADAAIAAEASTARAAESANATAISSEESRATAAENFISESLETYKSANDAALASEIASTNTDFANAATDRAAVRSEFAAADTTLQGNIDTEQTRSLAAEAAIQADVDANEAAADAAIAALQADVDGNEADADSAIAAMDAAYKAADAAIDTAYKAADSSATTDRAAIRSEFASADSALSSSVAARMATDEARMDAVLLAADADKDSFAEIVSLINSVDTENDDALAAYVLSNNAALAAEETRATDAEAGIQSALDTQEAKQESERAAMDAAYKAADAAMDAAYKAADAALQADIDQNEADADSAIAALQADVDGNEADADAAIAAMDVAYKAADAALTGKIEAEQARAEAAEAVLTTSVNNLVENSVDSAVDSMSEIVDGHNAAMAILKVTYARHMVQTAQPDGEATSFMFDKTLMDGSEQLYLNGQLMEVNLDYTIEGEEGVGSFGFTIDRGDDEAPLVEGDRIVVYGVNADLDGIKTLTAPSLGGGDDADGEG